MRRVTTNPTTKEVFMNRKPISILLSALFLSVSMAAVSCAPDKSDDNQSKVYTVTWKNSDGEVLEVDTKVKAASTPSFDGATPTKVGDAQYTYVFSGWSPAVGKVTQDITYTATYTTNTNSYTVVWKNHDGTVLETDADVAYGTTPEYNGKTPEKAGTADVGYTFAGWTPAVDKVTGNATYTAKFTAKYLGEQIDGVVPVFSSDGKTVRYGFYPQTHVSDDAVIAELNALTSAEKNGTYLLNGEYYVKQTANVCNGESYTFDGGAEITDGDEYWFKCEIITWRVLSNADGTYVLLSDKLLDAHAYYGDYSNRTVDGVTVYANNYEHSDIRSWLNNEFYGLAFSRNDIHVEDGADNGGKVYLPSYADYLNSDYGFGSNADDKSATRECVTTDYARARGAWCNTQNNGSYWTRTPSSKYNYCAWNVNSGGYLSEYAVDGGDHCVRPCITLSYSE